MLEEEHRVRVADRALEEPLGVAGRRRRHDFEPRYVGKGGLDRLRVVEPAVDSGAVGRADDQWAAPGAIRSVAHPRGLAHDLIHRRPDEVGELDLRDRAVAGDARADRHADDCRLGQRGIDDPGLAVPIEQPLGGAENAAPDADVLAEDDDLVVARHLLVDCVVDGLEDVFHAHPLLSAA